MSLNVKNLGWWKPDGEYAQRNNTVVLPVSDGTTIVVVPDSNSPEANAVNGTYGDGTDTDTIRVFQINGAFTASVEVASFSTTLLDDYNCISADLFEDGSIGIAYLTKNNGIRYRKVTTGTWAVGAFETVRAAVGGTCRQLDVSISKGDAVTVAHIVTNAASPKAALKLTTRATGGGWTANADTNLFTGADPNPNMFSLSIQYSRSGAAGARPLSMLVGKAVQDGADSGFTLYSAITDEAAGTISNITNRKTYLAGDQTAKWGQFVRRGYLFNSDNGSEITVAIMQAADGKHMMIGRVTWDNTTWTEVIVPQQSNVDLDKAKSKYRFAASYANDRVNFYYIADFDPAAAVNYVAHIDRDDNSVTFSGYYRWDNMENTSSDRMYPMAGTGKFAYHANCQHVMVYFGVNSNGLWQMRAHHVEAAPAPTNLSPVDGVAAPSNTPNVSLRASLGKKWPQSRHKAVWEFATDPTFTTDLRHFEETDDKFVRIENTDVATAYTYFADTLPDSLALFSSTWYVRGALIDEFGEIGNYTPTNSFTLSHPPSAINLFPNTGTTLSAGYVIFTWDFTDPSSTDTQSAFQIVIEDNDTGAVIHDSGQQSFSYTSYLFTLSDVYQGKLLRWRIRLWDADGTVGEYSDYETFTVGAAPSVVIDSPTEGGTVNSGSPRILFTPTTSGGRKITRYQVTLLEGTEVIRDSGVQSVASDSGVQLAWRVDGDILDDGASYKVRVTVGDETGLSGSATVNSFAIDYVAPANSSGVAVTTTDYATDGLGYVTVSWNDVNRDADFEAWVVYRKSDEIGLDGVTVVELGEWEEITRVYAPATSYNFLDYYAPSGYKVSYKIKQLVDRDGDLALSGDGTVATVYPKAEGYWIIVPTSEDGIVDMAFRLSNVSDDGYTDEYEENTYTIIGRGRHIDSGDHLGVNGSMTAKLRDSEGKTARQKKKQVEAARDAKTSLFLRTPFGDVYRVRLSNLSISRIAGVGTSEFCDMTIPYTEVAG